MLDARFGAVNQGRELLGHKGKGSLLVEQSQGEEESGREHEGGAWGSPTISHGEEILWVALREIGPLPRVLVEEHSLPLYGQGAAEIH